MQKQSVGILASLVVVLMVSMSSATILYYDDGSTVTSNWSLNGTATLTSDGNVLNLKGASSGDYAILNFDSSNGMTLVFDFKITNPGTFFGTYVYNPSEGVRGNSSREVYSSYNGTSLGTLSADTWYTVAIYSLGNDNYTYSQSVYVTEGKSVDMTGQSPVYSYTTPYAYGTLTSNHAVFFAYTGADLQLDDVQVNSGLDLKVPEPVSLCLLGIGGLTLLRRKQ
jgi:hypothetical protein